jgi:hypothetical protein
LGLSSSQLQAPNGTIGQAHLELTFDKDIEIDSMLFKNFVGAIV